VKLRALLPIAAIVALFFQSCNPPTAGENLEDSPYPILDSMLQAAVDLDALPGGIVCILRGDEVVHYKAFGWSNPLDSLPMQEDAIFRICSQTKALTSTAAMLLWERGLLDLDDPVSKYIPSFSGLAILDSVSLDSSHVTTPAKSTMTVRHLMTHQSGLSYGEIGDPRFKMLYEKHGVVDLFTTDSVTAASNADRIAQTALIHEPGARWNYSLGLDVLVQVIEVVAHEPFDEFLRREILDPLEMNDTHFYLPEELEPRLVDVWEPDASGRWKRHEHPNYSIDYPVAGARSYFSGGAGLCSTPLDYARFLQMYVNGGEFHGQRILQASTVDSVMVNQERHSRESNWYQGLAFGVEKEGSEGVFPSGTFFWGGYFNTTYAADPKSGTIGILMKQTYGANEPTTGQFHSEVFGTLR